MYPHPEELQNQRAATRHPDSPWEGLRFVVIDTEMTGLDPRVDRLVSVGAIACIGLELVLGDAFEAYVRISHNTSAVHIHGITREVAEAEGASEPDVLRSFLRFLRDGIIVGHHVIDDVTMLERACERCLGFARLPNPVIDTMDLTLGLEQVGILSPPGDESDLDYSLDGLCRRFDIEPHDRHTATGDAFLTGQVFLKLLRRARNGGFVRLDQLLERAGATDPWVKGAGPPALREPR